MLRRNPDALAVAAITFAMLAFTSPRAPVSAPQVTPIRVQMQANRDCIRAQMQAHKSVIREAVLQSVAEAKRAIAAKLHRQY